MKNVQKQGLHLKEAFAFNISITLFLLCHFFKNNSVFIKSKILCKDI